MEVSETTGTVVALNGRILTVQLEDGRDVDAVISSRRLGCLFGPIVGWKAKIIFRTHPKPARVIGLERPDPSE